MSRKKRESNVYWYFDNGLGDWSSVSNLGCFIKGGVFDLRI